MRYDCHMHMLLDGVYWRGAIDRHRDAVDIAFIQKCLEQYQKLGFVYLRDGGDRWGVGAKAREIAPEYGITYRCPLSNLCKAGHYGAFIGEKYADFKEYAAKVDNNNAYIEFEYTDEYGTTDGYMDCTDGNGAALSMDTFFTADAAMTGESCSYMAIEDDNGWSFHRFYVGVTHLNLRPDADGVGYKATIAGNDAVLGQIKNYGYKLWLTKEKVAVATKDGAPAENMTTVTARVQNFDVAAYGETPVNGSVFIELQDGTVIESSTVTFTLRDLLETISANASIPSRVFCSSFQAVR